MDSARSQGYVRMGLRFDQQLDGFLKPTPSHLVWNESFIPFSEKALESHKVSLHKFEEENMLLQGEKQERFYKGKSSANFTCFT